MCIESESLCRYPKKTKHDYKSLYTAAPLPIEHIEKMAEDCMKDVDDEEDEDLEGDEDLLVSFRSEILPAEPLHIQNLMVSVCRPPRLSCRRLWVTRKLGMKITRLRH